MHRGMKALLVAGLSLAAIAVLQALDGKPETR
jgi:hypothetical protein